MFVCTNQNVVAKYKKKQRYCAEYRWDEYLINFSLTCFRNVAVIYFTEV